MVLAVLVAFGAVVGASGGIQASQRRARREEHRSRKNNLVVHCPKSSAYAPLLEGRRVVLSGGRLYVDTSDSPDPDAPFGHPFAGYYLPYPDARYAGLVSTITDVAPIMNWVFVDRTSYALGYGARAAAEGQYTGPWDCTRQDRRLTFGGWEGFVAVRQPPEIGGGFWQLFFDRDADRLQARRATMPPGTVAVEVELARRELRTPAPEPIEEGKEEKGETEQTEKTEVHEGETKDNEKDKGKETQAQPESNGQSLTAEQVAELQRRLQAEEDTQKKQQIDAARETARREASRGRHGAEGDAEPTTTQPPGRRQNHGKSSRTASVGADTDSASMHSHCSRRSNRSRRSNKSGRSVQSVQSTKSTQSSAQHSIKTAGTSTTSSQPGRDKDTDTDEDGGYSSSVYSGYFASQSGRMSSSSNFSATPEGQ